MSDKKHCCETCKHFDKRGPYCVEDGDQVGLSKEELSPNRWCCRWKDEDDTSPDDDWA